MNAIIFFVLIDRFNLPLGKRRKWWRVSVSIFRDEKKAMEALDEAQEFVEEEYLHMIRLVKIRLF